MSALNFDQFTNRPDKLLRVHLSLNTDSCEPNREAQSPALNTVSYQRHGIHSVQLPSIFSTVVYQVVIQTWCETGFGNHSIESEIKNGKIKAILWAGTSYIGHISEEELHELKQFRNMLHRHIRLAS